MTVHNLQSLTVLLEYIIVITRHSKGFLFMFITLADQVIYTYCFNATNSVFPLIPNWTVCMCVYVQYIIDTVIIHVFLCLYA